MLLMKKIVYILLVVIVGSLTFSCKNDTKELKDEPVVTQEQLDALEQERIKEEKEAKSRVVQANSVFAKLMITTETKAFASAAISGYLSDMLLNEEGPFTIFAPSVDAFEGLDPEYKTILKNATERLFLERILRSHIVAGQIDSIALTKNIRSGNGSYQITTMSGEILVATKKGMDIVLKDKNGVKAVIVKSDILGSNGVVHVLDKMLSLKK
jgi:uncharacterized surface protein with fasciclin (FAS1) repeats